MEEFGIKEWLKEYGKLKKEFWTMLAGLTIIIVCLLLIPKRETSETNNYESKDFFSDAIIEYEKATGKKIYPTGREFLQRAMERDNLTSKEQVLELIRKNEKFMWKNP